MSKYSHYEMCEKIFGSRYKFNEQTGQMVVYTRKDMWDKLIEQQNQILELKEDLNNSEQKCLICNQDKISFAVEQINKTVEVAKQILGYEKIIDYFYQVYFEYEIDNLINQLKGEKL